MEKGPVEESGFRIQPFETEITGLPVGRLFYSGGDTGKLIEVWKKQGVWFVSCRVPKGTTVDGFREIETLVTFECNTRAPSVTSATFAQPQDHDECVEVARKAFTNDRLHKDPMFPDHWADRIREAWVRNDLNGRAGASFVVLRNGVAGFVLCLPGDTPVIDLIAVAPDHQKTGIGKELIRAVQTLYAGLPIRVGTQADNAASIALYEKTGFREVKRETTFHWINEELVRTC